MKILLVNKFNYINRGADKHFFDQASLLRSQGHEVAIFSMDSPKNEFSPWKKYFVSYVGFKEDDSFWSKLKGMGRIYSWEARRKMKNMLDDFRPDVVHIHNIYHHISPSILPVIKKKGIPIIMTVHDYHLISPDYLLGNGKKSWENLKPNKYVNFVRYKCFKNSYLKSLLAALEFGLYKALDIYEKNVDIFISPSDFTKDKLVKAGFREDKIKVIPHFIQNRVEDKPLQKMKGKYALYLGSISREKEVDKLIDIFQNMQGISLYLAGGVEGNFKIEKSDNIKYLGFLKTKDLEKYIQGSMFVVSPSRLPETFGLIALEAMRLGKPFIGFDFGAYREIVEDNKAGYLCQDFTELEERMKTLSNDEGLRILFSRNALERARHFDDSAYYERLMEIYRPLIVKRTKNLTLKPFIAKI